MQLNPAHVKVSELLNGKLFRIPEYQRAYAWGARQREDLFGDIRDVRRTGREHFMATVVALARETRLIGADQYRTVEIVDGQQRVTTLVILLKAIEKALAETDDGEAKIKRQIGELLVKGDEHSLVLLQTNHDSSHIFTNYIRNGIIDVKAAVAAADVNLVNAAKECEAFVSAWASTSPLTDLVTLIRHSLSMIYHELADEATVYRVFEVLNSRGLDVKWIDKLKSQLMALIFEHVEVGTRGEAVKEMQGYWQDIYRILGLRGGLGDEALRFAGTWAMSWRQNRIISQEEAAGVLTQLAGTKLSSIVAVGARLKEVVEAVDELDRNARLRAVTGIVHARFVAIAILLRRFDKAVRDRLLGRWERVTFRIFGIGDADARNKVGDYVRLGYDIAQGKLTADEIDASLKTLGSDYGIDKVLDQANWWDSYDGWTEELRYVLFRYDEYLASKSGGSLNANQWNQVWAAEPAQSIEHITPQSSGRSYIHHLGNLTVLPPGVNSSLRDKPPAKKAETYKTSGIRGTIQVGKRVEAAGKWTEEMILQRADEIIAFARKEWAD